MHRQIPDCDEPMSAKSSSASLLQPGDLEIIRGSNLFKDMDEPVLQTLLAGSSVMDAGRGEVLFLQGDPADAFFVVLEGWIKVYRVTPGGDEAVVGIFTDGQNFAEAAAFIDGAYPASGEAVTESRIARIPARHLKKRMAENPEIGLAMLASTSRHLHLLIRQIEQLKAHTGAQRVAEFLSSLTRVESGACMLALPYDKTLIAARLGMKPESLSRAFQRLKGQGVEIKNNVALIDDIERLRGFVDQERAEVIRSGKRS
ncbi:Crp/Fnr family transcriptional regulator [Notoacmeibacter marinus]|uniref:Crp/Fnr family transcriptional regulator n=1 Tax=Notoacmeibacter marinus TaxID=1876515 RepID=UPI001964A3A7|nr:Crp/Fnr family transcriptional regulator [Notoacmeibacter marinus]